MDADTPREFFCLKDENNCRQLQFYKQREQSDKFYSKFSLDATQKDHEIEQNMCFPKRGMLVLQEHHKNCPKPRQAAGRSILLILGDLNVLRTYIKQPTAGSQSRTILASSCIHQH